MISVTVDTTQLISKINSMVGNKKVENIVSKVASVGEAEATINFMTAIYDGTNDVEVSSSVSGSTGEVNATGRAVCFIEYGTGVFSPEYIGNKVAGIVPHGEYGKKHGKNPPWYYPAENGKGTNGILTKDGKFYGTFGNPPAEAMYRASKKMREFIQSGLRGLK